MLWQESARLSTAPELLLRTLTAEGEINDDDELPDDDDEVLGEWAVLTEDDELLNMMANSFSISEMDSTYQEIQQSMNCSDVNPAALESLQNVQID